MFFSARDRVALDVAFGVPVTYFVCMGSKSLGNCNVVVASYGSVAGTRKLASVRGLETMCECELLSCNCAFDNSRDGLGARIRALRGTLLTHLAFARHVSRGNVGPTLCFTHGSIFKYEVSEDPRLAVVSVGAKPFLQLVDAGAQNAICHWRARGDDSCFAVAPWGSIGEKLLCLIALGRLHVVW